MSRIWGKEFLSYFCPCLIYLTFFFRWTIEAVAAGARDVGYPSVAHGMFSRGPIELVDYFMDSCHDQLKERLLNFTDELQKMSVSDRLKFGVRSRLELMSPFIESWPQVYFNYHSDHMMV
jgi:ubiquinone biosynthesis protein COQ9